MQITIYVLFIDEQRKLVLKPITGPTSGTTMCHAARYERLAFFLCCVFYRYTLSFGPMSQLWGGTPCFRTDFYLRSRAARFTRTRYDKILGTVRSSR